MEELFQYMKTLRSQIDDVADQAAKQSVEEHMQCTTIQTLQKDLDLVKNETRQVKEETDQMTKLKGQICLQILEKQRKLAAFESDSYTLCQTLQFMQQERLSLSAKLVDRSEYYKKVTEDISKQLAEQQGWANTRNISSETREGLGDILSITIEEPCMLRRMLVEQKFPDEVDQSMKMDFQAAQAKLDKIEQLKSNLVSENTELRQSVELVQTKMTNFKPELIEMDEKSLNEELQALLSDKAGETEYVQSLQLQITRLKEISHTIRCSCGEEYNVKLEL